MSTMFERAGNTPGVHWSDRFLVHLASMLDNADAALETFDADAGVLVPRHAWEIVRLSGLPLPAALVGVANRFLNAPESLPPNQVKKVTELWEDIVQSFLLREGGVPEFLLALDRESVGPVKVSPWRDLDWNQLMGVPPDAPAPVVGAAVFASAPSPTVLSDTIPNTSAPERPSWWGVTTGHLENARAHLRKSMPLSPDDTRPGFLALGGTGSAPFVLDTRPGTVAHAHTPTKWRSRVVLGGLGLRYKEDWRALHVGDIEPAAADAGDAWVAPASIKLEMKGCSFSQMQVTASAGGQLQIAFDLQVEFTASRDRQSGDLSGSWNPERRLKATIDVRLRHGGQWEAARRVATEIKVIIPSPFSPTVLVTADDKLKAVGPDDEESFAAVNAGATTWSAVTTPTILLDEEGRFAVGVYDGVLEPWSAAFRDVGEPAVDDVAFAPSPSGFFPAAEHDLDDGVVVSDNHPMHGGEIAVFRVKERSKNLSSGILSAVRGLPSGRRPPAAAAREGVLGQYQDSITPVLCASSPASLDSLYQHVIAASDDPITWTEHLGGPAPQILFDRPDGFVLPGVGNGPTLSLTATPEWANFMAVMGQVCAGIGLRPGAETMW
ncbi:MAG: hypothetical protein KY475_04840, partial [Planctomycetes bacterium]|nr:hypothetical protein [Planctomycetota bacterium]